MFESRIISFPAAISTLNVDLSVLARLFYRSMKTLLYFKAANNLIKFDA